MLHWVSDTAKAVDRLHVLARITRTGSRTQTHPGRCIHTSMTTDSPFMCVSVAATPSTSSGNTKAIANARAFGGTLALHF